MFHYAYVDSPQLTFPNLVDPNQPAQFNIDVQNYSSDYLSTSNNDRFDFITSALHNNPEYSATDYISFTLDSYGNYQKPPTWLSTRASPGKIQEAISRIFLARNAGLQALSDNQSLKRKLDVNIEYFQAKLANDDLVHSSDHLAAVSATLVASALYAGKIGAEIYKQTEFAFENSTKTAMAAIPKSTIVGLADGGDILSGARAAIFASYAIAQEVGGPLSIIKDAVVGAFQTASESYTAFHNADVVVPAGLDLEDQRMVADLDTMLGDLQGSLFTINQRLQELDAAVRNYQSLVSQGDRVQQERQLFRQRSAAIVQGYRTRDAAFRLFRNEKLERYKTLFDLAGRYAFLAANAYDFETGLLNTDQGRSFLNRIISARALGVVINGEPQYAGSDTGDPGLSSALAEMKADWDVVKGRLGFNSPDAYGTTASLRTENYRIVPDTNGLANWQDVLRQSRRANLLDDADVRRYCMQIDPGDGLPVPGFVFEFSTTIANGYNLFGNQLAAGDHAYSPSSFATKIFAAGIGFPGYRGMDAPAANGSGVGASGGTSPSDPPSWYLDPLGLSATPYVYLIPVGVDSMRTPPLGDVSTIRTWAVNDVAVPLPFNIGASGFSTKPLYLSSDSLTEPLFAIRKHQAFRPVPDSSYFSTSLYGVAGTLQRSQYTNNRLIARSVWNSKWKLVIPNDPNAAMDRFTQTVTDIQLHFVTYSYSGN